MRLRGALACGLLAFLGCGNDDPVNLDASGPLRVEIRPSDLGLVPGQTGDLSVLVFGDRRVRDRTVRFTTSDSTIARVTQRSGIEAVVTAIAFGTATITAAAVADPVRKDSIRVSVRSAIIDPFYSIIITAVWVAGTTTAVDSFNVSGRIDVHMRIDAAPPGTVVRLLIGTAPAIECGAAPAGDQQFVVCPVDTAARDSLGARRYPNGSTVLSARLVRPDGMVIATGNRSLVLNN